MLDLALGYKIQYQNCIAKNAYAQKTPHSEAKSFLHSNHRVIFNGFYIVYFVGLGFLLFKIVSTKTPKIRKNLDEPSMILSWAEMESILPQNYHIYRIRVKGKYIYRVTDEINENTQAIQMHNKDGVMLALKKLASNAGCRYCADCVNCVDCIDCAECEACEQCLDSSSLSHCKDCVDCYSLSNCQGCEACGGCKNCLDCDECKSCESCVNCKNCHLCNDCEFCENCSDYDNLKNQSNRFGRVDLQRQYDDDDDDDE